MDKPNLTDFVLAPLHWLERARGWRRRALLFAYVLIGIIGGVFAWRELSLWRLPNAPEPFDLKKYGRVDLADADNAMPLYGVAGGKVENSGNNGSYSPAGRKPWDETDWSKADPEVIRWFEDSRLALEPWALAVEKPDALVCQPEEYTLSTLLRSPQAIRELSVMAALEGSRREQAGDLAGAWQMYRGVIRSSRHVGRYGVDIQRAIVANVMRRIQPRVSAWTDNPAVTSAMLRAAIRDVETCRAMTASSSDTIRTDYFAMREAFSNVPRWVNYELDDPLAWYDYIHSIRDARRFLRREPERSLRILRLIVAGNLAQATRPAAARPRLLYPKYMIYDHDERTPPAVRAISPAALNAWAENSALKNLGYPLAVVQPMIEAEVGVLDSIRIRMAERAHQIDHGRPPRTYSELLGPYLAALPDGIEPADPVGGAPPAVEQ